MHECVITGKIVGVGPATDWNGKEKPEMQRIQVQIDGQGTDTIVTRDVPTTEMPNPFWQQRFEITAQMTTRRAEKGGQVYERVGDVTTIKPAKPEQAQAKGAPPAPTPR